MQDTLNRIHIVPLTKEIIADPKAKLDHIAWIEESDPVVAVQKMVQALDREPFNCAVWVNADAGEDTGWRNEVLKWQQECALDEPNLPYLKDRCGHADVAATLKALASEFEWARGKKPPASLQSHMERRIRTIYNAVADIDISFELRRQETHRAERAHADGRPSQLKIWRFLEATGMMTYLFSNKDTVLKWSDGEADFGIPRQGILTAYQAPLNSLILLSNATWRWRPIVHDNPFLPPQQTPQKRTVMVYDMYRLKK